MPTILEDYFDFSDPEEIRIQGHRVYLHHVLFEYVDGLTCEQLVERFSTLAKDKVLACLLYYHRNQTELDVYLAKLRKHFADEEAKSRSQHGNLREELLRRLHDRGVATRESA